MTDARITYRFMGRRAQLTCALLDDDSQPTGQSLAAYAPLPPQGHRIPHRSKFYSWWCIALGGRKPSRADRPTLCIFIERLFRVRTHVVKRDGRQTPLPESLWYSTVEDLLPPEHGKCP